MQPTFPLRVECPPGACICERERLLADPHGDLRPLRLTRQEELKLIERIERIGSYAELQRMQALIAQNLGVVLRVAPSTREVRSVRGILIVLEERPGLCKKIRQSVPAALRRALEREPQIVFDLLDANDLFGAP